MKGRLFEYSAFRTQNSTRRGRSLSAFILFISRSASQMSKLNLLALRAGSEAGWARISAPVFPEFLFFRYVYGTPVLLYRCRAMLHRFEHKLRWIFSLFSGFISIIIRLIGKPGRSLE
uniref:Uncharacterized protein n=1 Tax=Candidatus Kentrum sp. LFY TaxID=2126342 RepID=A0A450UJC1_9GAMM|nr:MAG: hypothetical protein BECKLFY1418B_GA0070995_103720 [Candidatus Kentron sp. LFY]